MQAVLDRMRVMFIVNAPRSVFYKISLHKSQSFFMLNYSQKLSNIKFWAIQISLTQKPEKPLKLFRGKTVLFTHQLYIEHVKVSHLCQMQRADRDCGYSALIKLIRLIKCLNNDTGELKTINEYSYSKLLLKLRHREKSFHGNINLLLFFSDHTLCSKPRVDFVLVYILALKLFSLYPYIPFSVVAVFRHIFL